MSSRKSFQSGEYLKRKNSLRLFGRFKRNFDANPSAPPLSEVYDDDNEKENKTTNSNKNNKDKRMSSANGENNATETYEGFYENNLSFWDVKNYRIALKRHDNGKKLGTELAEMIKERAEIEQNYARALGVWSSKWTEHLNSETYEYGTTRDAWQAFLDAGLKTAAIHSDASEKIHANVITKIKQFIKDKYVKHFFKYKKTKELETEFEEAQKDWARLIERMNKLKRDYAESGKQVRTATEAVRQADLNSKYSDEHKQKLAIKCETHKKEEETVRKKYQDTIDELQRQKPHYVEKMSVVFDKAQNLEQERMIFVKQTLNECHSILETYKDERYSMLFEQLAEKINQVNAMADTEWWKANFGTGTKANWPKFEEIKE